MLSDHLYIRVLTSYQKWSKLCRIGYKDSIDTKNTKNGKIERGPIFEAIEIVKRPKRLLFFYIFKIYLQYTQFSNGVKNKLFGAFNIIFFFFQSKEYIHRVYPTTTKTHVFREYLQNICTVNFSLNN